MSRVLTPEQREHKNAHNREYARERAKTVKRVLTPEQKRRKLDHDNERKRWQRVYRLYLLLLEQRGVPTT